MLTTSHNQFPELRLTNPINPWQTRRNTNHNELHAENLNNQNLHAMGRNLSHSNYNADNTQSIQQFSTHVVEAIDKLMNEFKSIITPMLIILNKLLDKLA